MRTLATASVITCLSLFAAAQIAPTGSIEASTVDGTCPEGTALRLWEIERGPIGVMSRRGRSPIKSRDCRWTLSGLKAGTYQIDLIVPTGSAGSSDEFLVRDGNMTRIVIAPATARVTGRVTVLGKPLAAARLEFSPRRRQYGPMVLRTNPNGQYSVTLPDAGTYEMSLAGGSAPTSSRVVDVTAGLTTIDWAIASGGSVTVRLRDRRVGLPTTVHVASRRATHSGDVAHEDAVLNKVGLDFDEYSVFATQGDGALVSEIKTIRLDVQNPAAVVDLDLVENRSVLVLSDDNGNPPRNAIVRAAVPTQFLISGGRLLKQAEPGVFPLEGLAPGMFLLVRAEGFAPACRTVPLNSTVHASVEVGRRVDIQFPRDLTPAVVRELSALTDVPGSDCPVPLADFKPQYKTPQQTDKPLTFEFEHFPSSSRFGLMRFPLPLRQILVPDHGEVIVERH